MISLTKLPAILFISVACGMNKLQKIVYPVKKKFFSSIISLKKLDVGELTQLLSTANKGRIIFHVTAVGRSAAHQG